MENDSVKIRTQNLLTLAWPIFLQNVTNGFVMFADFWFFSYLSDEIAGILGQLLPMFFVGAFVIPVFAGTGISVASQFMGAGKHEKVVPSYMMNLFLTTMLGIIFAIVLLTNADNLGIWIGMDRSMSKIGGDYFGIIGYYFIGMGVYVSYNAILSSRGQTHWLMYLSFAVAGTNLVLNSLFVFVFELGVQGVAVASVTGVSVGLLLSIYLVHKRLCVRFYLKGLLGQMRTILRPMIRLGVSNALEPFSYTIQQIVISSFIVALGLTSMATNSYAGRLQFFQITFSISLASAAQILMAHWMGAAKFDQVHRLFWRTILYSTSVAFVFATTLWLFADRALLVFTNDPAILALGKTILLVSVFLEPARAVNIIGGFSLRTVGDTRFPLVIGMIFIWGILPIIYLLDHRISLSLLGLWICFAADEIIRAIIVLLRWQTGKWKQMGFAVIS